MVQRRLTQPASNPAPAPSQPAATPTPATAVLEPPAAATQVAAAPTFALTPAASAAFAASGQLASANPEPMAEGSSTPYVFFFHKLSANALKVAQKFPHVADGDPVLAIGGEFYLVKDKPFAILNEFQYWIETDDSGKPTSTRLDAPPGRGDWKEQILTLLVQFSEVGPVLTTTGLRTVKCPIAKTLKKAHDEAVTGKGLGSQPRYGAMVQAQFPPRYRIVGNYRLTPKVGKNSYVQGDATPRLIGDEEVRQLMEWLGSPEGLEELNGVQAAFTDEVASIKKRAAGQR